MTLKSSVQIIFNADDYGYSPGIAKGIDKTLDGGMVKSTSVMVNRPAAKLARKLPAEFPDISIGLHLDMTEEGLPRWTKIFRMQFWPKKVLEDEVRRQIDKFIKIVGQPPHHIDSHHAIHRLVPNIALAVKKLSRKLTIPVRGVEARFNMGFYGRSLFKWNDPDKVSPEALIRLLSGLPPGVHEIMTHPGYIDHGLKHMGRTYLYQREEEVKTLTSQKVLDFLSENSQIEVISWRDVNLSRQLS